MSEPEGVEVLASGRGFADLSHWRKVSISGADSMNWLNGLVSADISDLAPGRSRRALLLSPTGRVRAEFTVTIPGGTLLLIQDPAQPRPIDELLAPFILSSDVALQDRTDDLVLFALPGRTVAPNAPGAAFSAPSCLGGGLDLVSLRDDHSRLTRSLSKLATLVDDRAVEAWRVVAGVPRLGVDALEEDLPQECGLADAIAFDKGCFPGQEAVAKVRNLGHPRRLLLHLRSDAVVAAADTVTVAGKDVGTISSATVSAGGSVVLARIGWQARGGPFRVGESELTAAGATTASSET